MNFVQALDEAPVGVLVVSGNDDVVVFANRSFAESFDWQPDELKGRGVNDLLGEDGAQKFALTSKSKRIIVESRLVDYHDLAENKTYKICYVTPSVQPSSVDADLYLNAILDHFPDSIYFKDKQSRFLRVNRAFMERYAREFGDDVSGKSDRDIFTDEHAHQAFQDEQQILRSEVPLLNKEEKEITLADGSVSWVSTSKMPFYDKNNQLVGTFGVSKDITHLKLAEFQVQENLNILKGITYNIPIIIFKFDKKKKEFEFVGRKDIETTFRKSKVAKLNIENNLDYILDIATGNKERQGYLSFTSSYIEDDKEIYFDNYIFESVTDKNYYIGVSIDVSERKQSEVHIKRYTKSLEKINKELNQFAYIISHDLKAPLRAISNLSEWIEEDLEEYDNEEVKENLQLLRNRVARLENLINGILNYSRAGRDTSLEDDIDVRKVIDELMDSLDIPEGFELKVSGDLPKMRFNRSNLERIFINLITNAFKHHDKEKGTITINYQSSKTHHEFSVEDDGPGIEKEYHDKIFVIFQTLKARDSFESTGIGLTIVKKIVEDCGGEIELDSIPGRGSKFTFRIPMKIS